MKGLAIGLLLAITVASPAWAWGGLFNRFNPSLMSDMYGDSYGKQLFRAAEERRPGAAQVRPTLFACLENITVLWTFFQDLAEIIEEELEAEAQDPCNGRTCSMNEQCCNGHVCVDTEDSKTNYSKKYTSHLRSCFVIVMGRCLPVYGKKQGENCNRDTDCESGFVCLDSVAGRTCQTPLPGDKGLGKCKDAS